MRKKLLGFSLLLLALALTVVGCGGDKSEFKDNGNGNVNGAGNKFVTTAAVVKCEDGVATCEDKGKAVVVAGGSIFIDLAKKASLDWGRSDCTPPDNPVSGKGICTEITNGVLYTDTITGVEQLSITTDNVVTLSFIAYDGATDSISIYRIEPLPTMTFADPSPRVPFDSVATFEVKFCLTTETVTEIDPETGDETEKDITVEACEDKMKDQPVKFALIAPYATKLDPDGNPYTEDELIGECEKNAAGQLTEYGCWARQGGLLGDLSIVDNKTATFTTKTTAGKLTVRAEAETKDGRKVRASYAITLVKPGAAAGKPAELAAFLPFNWWVPDSDGFWANRGEEPGPYDDATLWAAGVPNTAYVYLAYDFIAGALPIPEKIVGYDKVDTVAALKSGAWTVHVGPYSSTSLHRCHLIKLRSL